MSVKTKNYYGSPGLSTITDAELASVEIMCVTRSGSVHYEVPELPVNMDFFYERSAGRIWFDPSRPFVIGPIDLLNIKNVLDRLEKISVKFKY